MIVNGVPLGVQNQPYLIAELSANHGGDINNAFEAIRLAKESGATAVKIQSYTPDTMTLDSSKPDFLIRDGLWDGYTLYDLYKEAYTPFEWHEDLFKYAKEIGITMFSSPFDESAVDLLENLNVPAYKIASFELVDLDLISYVARTGKPMFMSTGMASDLEIEEAVLTAKNNGCTSLLLFHCVSSYPAKVEDCNLRRLKYLEQKYGANIGLSDHTTTNTASSISIGLGAIAIEKHFTPNHAIKSADSAFSLDPREFKEFANCTKSSWLALGTTSDKKSLDEIKNCKFRRSIYFVKELKSGETITSDHIKRIRPGAGLAPKYFGEVLGKTVIKDVEAGDPVTLEILE